MRWAIRGVGLLSTLVLARLLTPADFGIVAMGTLVGGLLSKMTEMGTWQLLLRMRNADRSAYDTAWTIMLIQGAVMSLLVSLAAYPAAAFFKEPRLTAVMQVSALGSIIISFTNIGTLMFRRDLDFRKDFIFEVVGKTLHVVPVFVLALIWRSYWALIIGRLIGHVLDVLFSYRMHPFRPRLSLQGWRQFASYSVWIVPVHVANFLNGKADVFIVGHSGTTAQMGAYNVASELSRMATSEITVPVARATYPNYAKLKEHVGELTKAFLIVLRSVGLVGFFMGFWIGAVADDFVHVVLGDQWGFAVPLMMWMGLRGAFAMVLGNVSGHILVIRHKERSMFVITWARLAVFSISIALTMYFGGDVADLAIAAAASTAAVMVACLFYLPRVLDVNALRLLLEVGRVFTIGLVMFTVIRALHWSDAPIRLLSLFMDSVVGVVVYVSLIGLTWHLAGRPDGPERRIMNLARRHLRGSGAKGGAE
jgi:O-antigen/teichoic acid export membrane protein